MQLSPSAQRVLGSLIEKSLATPQQYPLTRNALRVACNQATGREPVVDYDDNTVEEALAELREPLLVRTEVVRGSRTPTYSHRAEDQLGLDRREQAVIALLLLRGAQTEGELNNRSGRLYGFSSLDEVDQVLTTLAQRGHVERLERRPGEKAERWRHRLGPGDSGDTVAAGATPPRTLTEHEAAVPIVADPQPSELAELRRRIEQLEDEVARLRRRLDDPAPGGAGPFGAGGAP